ncbi:cell envelope integrity protein CreD [Labrenzia sp. VG12]|uniref:cell envelope integrity protein CreD n=1 Tax=Labrenzia sp. VG12 TaxID=2021862 RepID=UPI000B8C1203|nr:cell envelope integrity protein CreD [Labrenzia sp. VG12]ASP35553.1 cell envelope integrity protein CreD [Labrenzia sp. VG12]
MTDVSDTDATTGSAGNRPPPFRPRAFLNSPGVKFVLIGILTVMLMVPSLFVWILVEERADRAREVARDIAGSWGGTQEINGPYLVVPFSETVTIGTGDRGRTEVHWHTAVLFPEKLDVSGDLQVEERWKSIYSLPVYSGAVQLSGRFGAPPSNMFEPQKGGTVDIAADKALLVVGIGDVRALKNEVSLTLDGNAPIPFEPGPGPMVVSSGQFKAAPASASSGINAAVPPLKWRKGFAFQVPLDLNGSTAVYVAPAGQSTSVNLSSNWPHPGFTGAFLPDERTIADTGFEANWSIPYLARGIPKTLITNQLPLQSKLLGVKFVEPVNFYQTISRSLKYAIGFISLTFLAVFVLEMRSGWRFHWIQYALVGLALIIFYVMLLALAEHVGYGLAYLGAASAATVLNAAYVGTSLKSRSAGAVMFAVLATIFALLFALMREQDYALLIGSVIAFLALAVTMFVTQKIDWTGQDDTETAKSAAAA